jgi:U6 snRNA-associated Sm-like protein LSm7
MSQQQGRGEHRGGRGGGRGGGGRGGRGNHEGGRGGAQGGSGERPKKENILDLGKYMDKKITVKFTGGREGEFCSFLRWAGDCNSLGKMY